MSRLQGGGRFVAGAYAAAPPGLSEDRSAEESWYAALRSCGLVGGLELPYIGALHPAGTGRLIRLLDPGWRSVVTTMPGTGARLLDDPGYGLASGNPRSRSAAVRDIADALRETRRVRNELGPQSIVAIAVQSAPGFAPARGGPAPSASCFAESLAEITSWDWDGLTVAVEHCDAPVPGRSPAKGYLSLADEFAAVARVSSAAVRTGHTVNWARSAIETRGAHGPLEHIGQLVAAGSLAGLMFSGVSPAPTSYGGPFSDSHLPVSGTDQGAEPTSLLTPKAIRDALVMVRDTPGYLGVKVAAPAHERDLMSRLQPTFATLRSLLKAHEETSGISPAT